MYFREKRRKKKKRLRNAWSGRKETLNELENLFNSVNRGKESYMITTRKRRSSDDAAEM